MQVAPGDFWFHSGVSGLEEASGMILRLVLGWTESAVQTAFLV